MGPTWAAHMGSMSIWPRAPCPPQMGSRRMSPLGLVRAPLGQPIMGCQYGPHVGSPDGRHVGSPDGPHVGSPVGLDVHLTAGSMSAPIGGIAKFDHISSFIRDPLHWLPIRQR